MTGNALAKVRSFFVRGLAVLAVIVTYAVGAVGTQLAAGVGISALALTTSTIPAEAWCCRRRRRRLFVVAPRRRVFYRRRDWWGGWGGY
jgi:hypothetical protein